MSIIGRNTSAEGYFCPSCGTPVEMPTVLFGNSTPITCSACDWSGAHTQLAVAPFKHGFSSDAEIAETMVKELRNLLAKTAGQTYGSFLMKWGFMDGLSALQLASYLEAIARATVTAIFETRKQLVEEKARERIGHARSTKH